MIQDALWHVVCVQVLHSILYSFQESTPPPSGTRTLSKNIYVLHTTRHIILGTIRASELRGAPETVCEGILRFRELKIRWTIREFETKYCNRSTFSSWDSWVQETKSLQPNSMIGHAFVIGRRQTPYRAFENKNYYCTQSVCLPCDEHRCINNNSRGEDDVKTYLPNCW